MKGKKILAGILSAAMVLGTMVFPAFAEDTENVAEISGKGYASLAEAVGAANGGDTVKVLSDVILSDQVVINNNITLDLNGHTVTSNYAIQETPKGASIPLNYAFVFVNGGTITDSAEEKGALIATAARAINVKGDRFYVKDVTVKCTSNIPSGNAVIGTNNSLTMTNSAIIGEFAGSYTVSSFGAAAEDYIIENSKIVGTSFGIYRNGNSGTFKMTVKDSDVTANGAAAYISNTDKYPKHNVTFINTKLSGGTGIEAKFSNIDLENCTITASGTVTYGQNNNGATSSGFAVVITDNTVGGGKITPAGKINITSGTYTGLIGLENLDEGKYVEDEKKTDVVISGGKFTNDISAYCALGYETATEGEYTTVVKSNWETAVDSGSYGDGLLGMMRFMFSVTTDKTVKRAGIRYIKTAGGILDTARAITVAGDHKAIQGDVYGVPNGDSNTYYAAAFIETEDGKTIWTTPIECSVNWNQHFTNYTPSVSTAE